jgi:hypothetical protein
MGRKCYMENRYRTTNQRLEFLKTCCLLYGEKPGIVDIRSRSEMLSYKYLSNRGFIKLEKNGDEEKYKVTILPAAIDFIKQLEIRDTTVQ